MEWYLKVIQNYVGFDGRARRKEYWMFTLINLIILIVLFLISEAISNIYQLAVLIPTIAVGVRRMHDTNHSGWWLLFPIVNLIFAVTAGDRGENRFGPDPKAGEV